MVNADEILHHERQSVCAADGQARLTTRCCVTITAISLLVSQKPCPTCGARIILLKEPKPRGFSTPSSTCTSATERLAVGKQTRRVADPFGVRIIEDREHLLRRRLNIG